MHSSRRDKILARIEARKGPRETFKSGCTMIWTAEDIEMINRINNLNDGFRRALRPDDPQEKNPLTNLEVGELIEIIDFGPEGRQIGWWGGTEDRRKAMSLDAGVNYPQEPERPLANLEVMEQAAWLHADRNAASLGYLNAALGWAEEREAES